MKRSIITKQLAAIISCRGLLLNAFVIPTNRLVHNTICTNRAFSNIRGCISTIQSPLVKDNNTNTRLYSSLFNNNDDKKDGILTKLKDKAKSYLPKKWLSEKDQKKQASIERKREMKNELNSSLNTLLKDAPLAIRMMGKLVAPLVSTMAETFREQGEIISDVLYSAEELILGDDTARNVLGSSIQVGAPFSQSSNSSSINGVTTAKIQVSFPVQGQYQSGIATVVASSAGNTKPNIESLMLEVLGQRYSIGLIKSAGGDVYSGQASVVGKKKVRKGDIIDAEFVDKK